MELEPEQSSEERIQKLILAHMDYAKRVALKCARRLPRDVDRDDLVAEAHGALVAEAPKFDENANVSFSTFIYPRIAGSVYDYVRKLKRMPRGARTETRAARVQDELCAEGLGRAAPGASAEDAASAFRDAVRTLGRVYLMSQLADEEGEGGAEPVDPVSAADRAAQRDFIDKLRAELKNLNERELALVRHIYFEDLNVTECAVKMGVHKSNVTRLHYQVLERLKRALGGG